ncbi:Nlrc5 [Symbiodinium natans]|uniref:Nlrc5 protein n=1 Tax=Symbiodinium natans TaxID=878477 RepID=A0A812TA04_9DINO|nr:Nlrc5 [Symbiodinium natans]
MSWRPPLAPKCARGSGLTKGGRDSRSGALPVPCSTSYGIFILTAFGILERVQSFNSVAPEAFPPRVPFQRARSKRKGTRNLKWLHGDTGTPEEVIRAFGDPGAMVLEIERATQLQDELIQAYAEKSTFAQLQSLARQMKGDGPSALVAAQRREQLLLELQKPLVARYGYEASAKGVCDAMFDFSEIDDNNVTKRHNHMERLLACDQEIESYNAVHFQQYLRNAGTARPLPRNDFPLIERQDLAPSFEGRLMLRARQDMLPPSQTEELVAACKRGDGARAAVLLKGPSDTKAVSVNVGYKALGAAGARTLAKALGAQLEALEVDISGNGIGVEGAKALAASLPKGLKVLKLNLARNRLMLEGVKAIAASIPQGVEELVLGFSGMKMGPAGAALLAAAIPPKVRKLTLDLLGNRIGDEGVESISKALPKSLEYLHIVLSENGLSKRGFFMIDRQIGDPLHDRYLPNLQPESFIKGGEPELREFREEPDGTQTTQIEWHRAM